MGSKIQFFKNENEFLCTAYPQPILWEGVTYPSLAHAYLAAKIQDKSAKEKIRDAKTPEELRKLAGALKARDDWEDLKLKTMLMLLMLKFSKPELRKRLIATRGKELIYGNTNHDLFWGKCYCSAHHGAGDNHLGKLLEERRSAFTKPLPA